MPFNHLNLCCPLLLLPSVFPTIRVFSNESVLIVWPKYWSFSFSMSPSNEYLGLISFIIDWFDILVVKGCWEPARDIPLVTKVMRKGTRHTQRRDRASGVPPDILEHLPPKNQSLPTLLLCALTSAFTGGCPPPPSRSLCQRVNLQLQLIKFLGN